MGAILVAHDALSGAPVHWVPTGPGAGGNPHLLLLGASGQGKTHLLQLLAVQLVRAGIHVVIPDANSGFLAEGLHPELAATAPWIIEVAREGLALDPLLVDPTLPNAVRTAATDFVERFAEAHRRQGVRISPPQRGLLREAILAAFEEAGIAPDDPTTWTRPAPDLALVHAALVGRTGGTGRASAIAEALLSNSQTFWDSAVYRADGRPFGWGRLARARPHCTILQFRDLPRTVTALTIEILARDLLRFVKGRGQHPFWVAFLIDEAHTLDFVHRDSIFCTLLLEGRKFGLAMIVAGQQPSHVGKEVFGNTATKLLFACLDDNGLCRALERGHASLRQFALAETLGWLRPRELLVVATDGYHVGRVPPATDSPPLDPRVSGTPAAYVAAGTAAGLTVAELRELALERADTTDLARLTADQASGLLLAVESRQRERAFLARQRRRGGIGRR
jgi:hypothetical protein